MGLVWGCRGVDDNITACHKMKAMEFRVHSVGQDFSMAPISGLAGRHPSNVCLDGMVRCNIGLANLDYVGPFYRA